MSEGGAVHEPIGGDATATRGDATATGGVSPPAGSDAAARIEGLADDLLPALIARLESSALGELEVHTADWRVRLCKAAGGADRAAALAVSVGGTSPTGAHLASAVGVLAAGGTGAGTAAPGSRGGAAVAAPHLPVPSRVLAGGTGIGTAAPQHHGPADTAIVHVAVSPAVGFLVVRDGYGPGRAVLAGEVVGHVDCLGVMRDVTAPEDGVIARNLAEQGEAVEYGQPLFDIEPRAPETPAPPAPPAPPRPASLAAEGR